MYNPDVHNRQSIRLRDFDYGDAGAYFVTMCTWRRECLFGDVVDGAVRLNEFGAVVRDEWLRTPQIRTNVELDDFVVMPNHFHAILWIIDPVGARRAVPDFDRAVPDFDRAVPDFDRAVPDFDRAVPGFDRAVPGFDRAVPGFDRAVPGSKIATQRQGTARRAPTVEKFGRPVAGSLATIIRSFKSAATKRINTIRDNPGCPVWQRNYYERVVRGERDLYAIRKYITDNPTKWELDINHPTQI